MDRVSAASVALRALHATSLTRYDQLLGSLAAGLIEKTGQIYVWKSDHASPTEALARALREKQGVVTQALAAAQIRALDPDLAPGFSRGLFFPDNGHTVNPLRLVQTLVDLFVAAGGKVERRTVTGFEWGNEGVTTVRCDGESLAADAVVIAAGIRSRKLAQMLGDAVPLEGERGYHVMLPDPRVRPKIKISKRDQMFASRPWNTACGFPAPWSSQTPMRRWTSGARRCCCSTPSGCTRASTAKARSTGWARVPPRPTACPSWIAHRACAT